MKKMKESDKLEEDKEISDSDDKTTNGLDGYSDSKKKDSNNKEGDIAAESHNEAKSDSMNNNEKPNEEIKGDAQDIEKDGNNKENDETQKSDLDVSSLKEELDKFKTIALRSRADYDNLKKRNERQRIETKNFLIREIAGGILSCLDDFRRGLEAIGTPINNEEKGEKFDSVIKGVEMVIIKINEVLKGFGVEEIGFEGEDFNPAFHEAIQVLEDPQNNDQKVGLIFQKGYKIDDFVIRNARVQVIRGTQKNNPSAEKIESESSADKKS